MRKILIVLVVLAIPLVACGISIDITPPPAVIPTSVTPVSEPSATAVTSPPTEPIANPTNPPPTSIPTNATCNGFSFYLDPSISTGYTCQTIPEANDPDIGYYSVHPQYTEIKLQGYPLSGTLLEPQINVYPIDRYQVLLPEVLDKTLPALQNLISGGSVGDGSLPLLPVFNAAQLFYSQLTILPFQNGSGIRYLTEYAQYYAPFNNHDLFYSFQGITSDGKLWISIVLPVSNPILPVDGSNPPGGQTWEEFTNNYDAYKINMTNQLNSQTPESFNPNLAILDTLVQSILVQP